MTDKEEALGIGPEMPDVNHIIQEAERKLEENDFAAARDLYRNISLIRSPSGALLGNLSVAEDQERLAFRRTLSQRYPKDPRFRVIEAEALISINMPALAVDVCTRLLQSTTGQSSEQQLPLHMLRFRAAVGSGRYENLIEDVRLILEAGEWFAPAMRLRPRLWKGIAELNRPEAIPVLESLCERVALSEFVAAFIVSKIEELRYLASTAFPK